ncbi:hypothetical protein L1049_016699 [Liquidambar formosana]|uniref:Uncharacterized protein n=1 Tax=Liquidambar formosana TaxID=63359 RepID=A0AAP0X0S4_LIQFO
MDSNNSSGRQLPASRDNVTIEIKDDTLVSSIKEKMENTSPLLCICRVPETTRKENENAYAPGIISIGPLHHGKPTLKQMEDHKWRYLYTLLSRKPSQQEVATNLEASLDGCVKSLRESEHRARKCYAEDINLTSDEFVEMMLLDGCFIIELFLKYAFRGLRRRSDPIFFTTGIFCSLRLNMILLENQLPFFVLQQLFNIVPLPRQCTQSLTELAFRFFESIIPKDKHDKHVFQEKFNLEGNHLLDLIHNCLLPTISRVRPKKVGVQKRLDCATKLQEEGIKFNDKTAHSLLDVRFVNGVIEIPPMKILHYTETLLRNLVALEQCYGGCTPHVTSYAFLMKSLVCCEKDVRLLLRREILANSSGSEIEVLDLFKSLYKENDVKDFYYDGLCEQVNEYRRTSWFVWWRKLFLPNNVQKTPKSVMVLFAVVLFLLLTFLGTLFSILSFSRHGL